MARRESMVAIAALLMMLSTAFAPLAMAVPTTHGNLPTWKGSNGDQPSYSSGSSENIDIYLYFHKTTTSGAQYVLNTQGGSSGVDAMPRAAHVTFTLQEALTKNLKVFGHEIDTTHKGFWLDLTVTTAPPGATVTIEVLDNDMAIANKSQTFTGTFNRWTIPFVGGIDSYTFLKDHKIAVRISTTGSTAITYANGDKLWVLCDPVSLTEDSYNSNGIKSKMFYPYDVDENRHVVIKGKVDDAWGAGDVQSVTVDIKYITSGASVVNATATLDGLNYTYDWNYSKGVQPGSYEALVTMLDQQSHAFNTSVDFTMAQYGVHLDSPQATESGIIQGAAEKGGCTDYTLSILNIGGSQSSYTVSQTSSDVSGWTLTVSPTQTGAINPGESKIVTVKVCADESVAEGTYSTFYVQAQATADPSVKDSIQIMTMASPKVNLSLTWTPSGTCTNLVNTGASVSCTFTVQNTGLQTLNVTLKMTVEKGSPDWSAKVTPSNIMNIVLLLHPQAAVTGTLNISAPKDPSKQNTSIVDISAEVNDISPPLTKVIVAKTVMSTGINVECVGNCIAKIDSDKTAEFFVLVSNTDPNEAHTITMSTTQPSGWGVDFGASNKVFSLNAQESQTISIKATPASGSPAGTYNIEVTGKYQDNQNTWDKVVLQVTINEKHQLTLTVTPASKDVGAEAGASFTVTITNKGNVDEKQASLIVTLRSGDLKANIEIEGNKTSVKTVAIPRGQAKTYTVKITPKAEARHKDTGTYDIKVQGASSTSDSKQVTVNLKKSFSQLFMETIKDWQMWILIVLTLVVCIFYAIVARK